VVLPAVIVLYELVCRKRRFPWTKAALGCAAALIPLAAVLWQRATVLAASAPAEFPFVDNPIVGAGFWIGRLTALKVLSRYLWLAFWPIKLSSDYSYSEIPLVSGTAGDWIAWLGLAAAVALAVPMYRQNRIAYFFVSFAFLNLLPAANLLFPIGTIMAERLLYLPLAGLAAGVVVAIESWGEQFHLPRATAVVIVCLVAAAFMARTWMRNLDWRDDLTMATASAGTSPGSFKVHRLLAAALFQQDPQRAHIERVVAEADRSLVILGALPDELNVPGPWNLAAACHLAWGDVLPPSESRRQYEDAATIARRSIAIEAASRAAYDLRHGTKSPVPAGAADAYRLVASAYLRLRDGQQALPPAIEARTVNPSNVEAYTEIADAYLAQGRGEDAAIALAEGMFVTQDGSLRADLLKLYQSGVDQAGCAVIPGPRGPALNPSCAIVKRDLCAASARANRQDLWRQLQCRE
jgi:hypothetical protein